MQTLLQSRWLIIPKACLSGLLILVGTHSLISHAVTPEENAQAVQVMLEQPLGERFVPGEIIVKMKPVAGGAAALSRGELAPLGLQSSPQRTSGDELIYQLPAVTMRSFQSEKQMQDNVLAIVKELNQHSDVEYAQPNWIFQALDTTPNDILYPQQWHYFNNGNGSGESPGGINLPKAWDQTTGSDSVRAAVIDTGILPNHSDITGSPNLINGYDMISNTFIANDGDARDADPTDPGDAIAADECFPGSPAQPDSWHGTHVAGTIGVGNTNNNVGVAGNNWNVKLMAVRVLGKCGGTTADINDAIRWAAGLPVPGVPNNPNPVHVINMSLGGGTPCTDSPATQSAINDAVAAGVSVVVAAGNSAEDAAGFTPAGCDNVITVAASDARGHLVTRYSNFGSTVEIMAPGGDRNRDDTGDGNPDGVLSMVKGGYAYYNGTSMAAPHVAGVAAILLAQNPSLTPADVLQKLQDNAIPRDSTQCPKPCGAGLLNADFPADGNGKVTGRYQYSAKLVCGVQRDPRNLQLARGFYTTVVNILNPGDKTIELKKKLALAIPPGGQKPGKVIEIAADALRPQQALATDCEDIRRRVFNGQFPAPFIDGFVIIESQHSLNVSAVYSTATLNAEGTAEDHSSIHVEQIRERVFKTGGNGEKPDLVVKDIDLNSLRVSCPQGGGSCVTTVKVTIENIGAGTAGGTFNTRSVLDPAQSVNVDHASPAGLDAGATETFEVKSPAGGNCFDPDCTICVSVDDKDDVDETEESNNQMCRTKIG